MLLKHVLRVFLTPLKTFHRKHVPRESEQRFKLWEEDISIQDKQLDLIRACFFPSVLSLLQLNVGRRFKWWKCWVRESSDNRKLPMKKKPCWKNLFQNQDDMSQIGLLIILHSGKMQGWTNKQGSMSLNFLVDKICWSLEGEWVKVSAQKFVMAEVN